MKITSISKCSLNVIMQEYLTLFNGFNAPSKIEGCPNIEPAKSPKITTTEVNKAACDSIKSSTTIKAKFLRMLTMFSVRWTSQTQTGAFKRLKQPLLYRTSEPHMYRCRICFCYRYRSMYDGWNVDSKKVVHSIGLKKVSESQTRSSRNRISGNPKESKFSHLSYLKFVRCKLAKF